MSPARIPTRLRGVEGQRLYWVWAAMIQRCANPRVSNYDQYGGRGITVCARWQSFDAFQADMGLPPAPGMSLDRIDNDGPYAPGNVRWATRTEQSRNRPNWCRYVEVDGVRLTLREAWQHHADATVTYRSLVKRIVTRGWPVERALSTPSRAL